MDLPCSRGPGSDAASNRAALRYGDIAERTSRTRYVRGHSLLAGCWHECHCTRPRQRLAAGQYLAQPAGLDIRTVHCLNPPKSLNPPGALPAFRAILGEHAARLRAALPLSGIARTVPGAVVSIVTMMVWPARRYARTDTSCTGAALADPGTLGACQAIAVFTRIRSKRHS
jgi:hypothetical protein